MQGYVLTPDSAVRVLKCLDPPNHKVWAQVDEMIGCCAASSKTEPFTRCVYHTAIPTDVAVDMHVFCMTPALLVHLDKTLGSYAHRRKKYMPKKEPHAPVVTGLSLLKGVDSKDLLANDPSSRDVQTRIREL